MMDLAVCFTKNKTTCKQESNCKPIWRSDGLGSLLIPVGRWRWGSRLPLCLPQCGWTLRVDGIPSRPKISLHSYLEGDLREHLHLKTPLQPAQTHLLNKLTLISEEASIKEHDARGDLCADGSRSLSLCQDSICASG